MERRLLGSREISPAQEVRRLVRLIFVLICALIMTSLAMMMRGGGATSAITSRYHLLLRPSTFSTFGKFPPQIFLPAYRPESSCWGLVASATSTPRRYFGEGSAYNCARSGSGLAVAPTSPIERSRILRTGKWSISARVYSSPDKMPL